MSKKIYIDYANENYYTSKEEIEAIFEEEEGYSSFDSFLDYYYHIEEVFYFNEEDKKRIEEEYKNALDEELEDWVNARFTIVDIDIEFKESK